MLTRLEGGCRAQAPDPLVAGMPVVIAGGPLRGIRGTILCFADDDWPIVMVGLQRGAIPLELPPWWIHVDDGAAQVMPPVLH